MRRLAIALLFVLVSAINDSSWADNGQQVRALVVGVATYKYADGTSLRNLKGPVNDAKNVVTVLKDRFGVRDQDLILLRNEEATRARLLTELKRLFVTNANAGDVLLFYFAGHGSRVFDASMDEPSQYDDSILPFDARAPDNSVPDIIDDDLYALVQGAKDKGAYPVVILDSCHSATGIRFIGEPRGVKPVVKAGAKAEAPGKALPKSAERRTTKARPVLLAAAQDSEEALESERDGVVLGEFTRALVEVLSKAEEGITYLDVLTRIRVSLQSRAVPQQPQGEGDLQQKFLGTGPLARVPVLAKRIDRQLLRMQSGAIGGVTAGSTYAVYGSARDATRKEKSLASGSISKVLPNSAELRLTVPTDLPDTTFANELTHSYGNLRLKLRIEGGTPGQQAQVRAALAPLEFVEVMAAGNPTHWLRIAPEGVVLVRENGVAVGQSHKLDDDIASHFVDLLGKLAHYQALLSLTNPLVPVSPIRSQVLLADNEDDPGNPAQIRDGEYHVKSSASFKVRMFNAGADKPFVYLINLSADLCVTQLSPPPDGADEPLVGPMNTKLLQAAAEPGREFFLVIAAQQRLELQGLEQGCAGGALRDGAPEQLKDPLSQLLRDARSKRRGPVPDLPLDGWSTSFLTMVIDPP